MSNDTIIGVIVGIVVLLIGYGAFCLYSILSTISQTLTDLTSKLKSINRLSIYLLKNKEAVGSFGNDFREALDGANRINQDAVTANTVLAGEVAKFRQAADRFNAVMFPAEEPVERTPERIRDNFDTTFNELLKQGIDPERAKWMAAGEELNQLEEEGLGVHSGFGL